ncbi:hypothetical protein BC941DRAFT_6938 [Chlamydoabsidia padenii]|nr:hypothetical protein BC941DRAFT_6938 [Chlamydoabsidia padenii]
MLSAHSRDQMEDTTVLTHLNDTPPRISSLETMASTTATTNTNNADRSFVGKQHWKKQHHQYHSYENDERASTTTHSRPFFKKQPWQKNPEPSSLERKSSCESIRSNVSTTSSIFSTASKISKLPHVVKASVKGLVAKSASTSRRLTLMSHNGNSNSNSNSTAPLNLTASSSAYYQTSPPPSSLVSSSSSFGYRLRKRTPSALGLSNMFSRRRASMDQAVGAMDQVHPQESISYSVLKEEPYQRHVIPTSSSVAMRKTTSSSSSSSSIGSVATNGPPTLHHRLSRLHLSSSPVSSPSPSPHTISGTSGVSAGTASPVSSSTCPLPTSNLATANNSTTQNTDDLTAAPVTSPVGRLLFGKEVDILFENKHSNTADNGVQNDECVIQDDNLSTQVNILIYGIKKKRRRIDNKKRGGWWETIGGGEGGG